MWGYYLVNIKDGKLARIVGYDGQLSPSQGSIVGQYEVLYGDIGTKSKHLVTQMDYRVIHIYNEEQLIKLVFAE